MMTPDNGIVPLNEEDRSFPDEMKEVDDIEALEILLQKKEKFLRRKEQYKSK